MIKMKEIDINIEGYNVNGICVGCLNYNRKMFYNSEVKNCFRMLGNIEVPDGLSIQVCWECLAVIRNVCKFKLQIEKSYEILQAYSKQHTFLNSPHDLSKHAIKRLTMKECKPLVDIQENVTEDTGEDKSVMECDVTVVKEEYDQKLDSDNYVGQIIPIEVEVDDFQTFDQDTLSDDEPISRIRKRKKTKHRRSRTKEKDGAYDNEASEKETRHQQHHSARKLKNLPEDIVSLHSMSEEEMWAVRRGDLENRDFLKIKYKCDHCIIGFNTEKLMVDHMSAKHVKKKKSNQCDICKSYFLNKDNLSTHRSLHMTGYICRPCGFRTSLKKLMQRHVSARHKDRGDAAEGVEGEVHKCGVCSEEFSKKSKLVYHRAVCHQDKPQCDCCGKVFASKVSLKYHLKMLPYNKNEKEPKEKLYLPCKDCKKVFHSRKSYRAHVVIHDGVEYPCPVCGKLFMWRRNLARHLRNHRERDAGALHECRPCAKRFSSRDCYNNHMRFSKRHVDEHQYQHTCAHCGKKFPTKWCMIDHIDWDHLKNIKYQCAVCHKAFKTAKIKVAHMRNIHGSKREEPDGEHLCEVCGKSYKTVKRLKGHVWAMHTHRSTAKTFKCKMCPATFTWQTSIYKHMKMMHDTNKRPKMPTKSQPQMKLRADQMTYMSYYPAEARGEISNLIQSDNQDAILTNIV